MRSRFAGSSCIAAVVQAAHSHAAGCSSPIPNPEQKKPRQMQISLGSRPKQQDTIVAALNPDKTAANPDKTAQPGRPPPTRTPTVTSRPWRPADRSSHRGSSHRSMGVADTQAVITALRDPGVPPTHPRPQPHDPPCPRSWLFSPSGPEAAVAVGNMSRPRCGTDWLGELDAVDPRLTQPPLQGQLSTGP